MIANIARYHRRSLPKDRHFDYTALNPADREAVFKLGAIVRVADALDRGHDSRVSDLRCYRDDEVVHIQMLSALDCENEILEAERRCDMFEQAFKCNLSFNVRSTKAKKRA